MQISSHTKIKLLAFMEWLTAKAIFSQPPKSYKTIVLKEGETLYSGTAMTHAHIKELASKAEAEGRDPKLLPFTYVGQQGRLSPGKLLFLSSDFNAAFAYTKGCPQDDQGVIRAYRVSKPVTLIVMPLVEGYIEGDESIHACNDVVALGIGHGVIQFYSTTNPNLNEMLVCNPANFLQFIAQFRCIGKGKYIPDKTPFA